MLNLALTISVGVGWLDRFIFLFWETGLMFRQKKLVAFLIAFLFGITGFFMPVANQLVARAGVEDYTVLAGESMVINMPLGHVKEIKVDEFVDFEGYTSDPSVDVKVWSPNGIVINDWASANEYSYKFTNVGLHAIQFRKLFESESEEFYTYSQNYYINVKAEESTFILEGMLPNKAETGQAVTVPTGVFVTEALENITADIKVFDPYGKEVELNDSKFTLISNITGNYYIKYFTDSFVKYYIVEAVIDLSIPTDFSITIANKEGNLDYKESIDLFRYYDLSNITVSSVSGENVNTTTTVSIKNKSTGKYMVYQDNKWVESASEDAAAYDITDDSIKRFVISDTSSFGSGLIASKGASFVFVYKTTTCYGTTIEKSVTKSLAFNEKMFGINLKGYMPSKINAEIVTTVSDEKQDIFLPDFEIIINNDFDEESIRSIFDFEKKPTASTDSSIEFDESEGKFKLTYPAKITSTYGFTLKYNISYYDKINESEDKSYSTELLSKSITLAEIDSTKLKPNNIRLGKYSAVNFAGEDFVLPAVTANLFYEINASSYDILNNYNFVVLIDDVAVDKLPGDTTDLLKSEGVYKITYRATPHYGESRDYEFYVKTVARDFAISDSIEDTSIEIVGGNAEINGSYFAFAYNQNQIEKKIEFKTNSDGLPGSSKLALGAENYFVTLVLSDYTRAEFRTFVIVYNDSEINQFAPTPVSRHIASDDIDKSVVTLRANDSVEIVAGQAVTMPGKELKLETAAASDGIVIVGGVYYFYKVGEYRLADENNFYIVKVKAGSDFGLIFNQEPAPFVEFGKGLTVPYAALENVFGYTLAKVVQRSSGLVVSEDNLTEGIPVDNYKITYNFVLSTGEYKNFVYTVSSGNTSKPKIIIEGSYKNIEYAGEEILVDVIAATAIDKNNAEIKNIKIEVFDPNGKQLEIKENKFAVKMTGSYTIYYSVVDTDGISATEKIVFAVEYPQEPEAEKKLTGGQIAGIVIGSVVLAGLIAFVVIKVIKRHKSKTRFIKKSTSKGGAKKSTKSQQKNIFSIAPSKDGKQWFVKKNARMFAKLSSREEALDKAKLSIAAGDEIKIYNKAGRLIDTIK